MKAILILTLFSATILANPIQFGQIQQDQQQSNEPEFVRLSDGRIVPYGSGVICDSSIVIDNPGPNRKWLIPLIVIPAVVCIVLCQNDCPEKPIVPQLPPPWSKPPVTEPPPIITPDIPPLFALGFGLLILSQIWKREIKNSSR